MTNFRIAHVALFAVLTGCSPSGQPSANVKAPAANESKPAANSNASNAETGKWTYQSPEHGFALELPTAGWKPMKKKRFIADFWCPTGTGSPMLAGVTAVKKHSREQFQASIADFKANLKTDDTDLQKVTFQEGQSPSGNPYVYAMACQRGAGESQFIFMAAATVWLADKNLTVNSMFEGQGRMTNSLLQSVDYVDFEKAAKSICLSVK